MEKNTPKNETQIEPAAVKTVETAGLRFGNQTFPVDIIKAKEKIDEWRKDGKQSWLHPN
jgi:hypothetical protein